MASTSRTLRPRKEVKYNDNAGDGDKDEDVAHSDSTFKDSNSDSESEFVESKRKEKNSKKRKRSSYYDSSSSESESSGSKKKSKTEVEKPIPLSALKEINLIDEENEYQIMRKKNMEDRLNILKNMDIDMDIKELKKDDFSSKEKPVPKKKKPTPKIKAPSAPVAPTRKSSRISEKSVSYVYDQNEDSNSYEPNDKDKDDDNDNVAKPIFLEENLSLTDDTSTVSSYLDALQPKDIKPTDDFSSYDFAKFSNVIKSCVMVKGPEKLISSRITTLTIHPKSNNLLILAGDMKGNVSIWNSKADKRIEFYSHTSSVNCTSFCKQDDTKFYSTSLDGTTRKSDLVKNTAVLEFTSDSHKENHTTWHYECDDLLMIACGDGSVKFHDTRAGYDKVLNYKCHPRSVRTVQCHPRDDNYFLTSSGTGSFAIWDRRNVDEVAPKPILMEDIGKALTSAFYSHTGKYVLTTVNDDTIRIYDCTKSGETGLLRSITHNNHCGRWLSVFKARWHPNREDCFFVGSLQTNPKRMQAYNFMGRVFHEFSHPEQMVTYCPVMDIHPTLPIIVGGNASGNMHIFSPSPDFI